MGIIAEPYGKTRMTDLLSARIDTALPFQVHDLDVPRRVVRLTATASSVLGTGRYPPAVAEHLGETLALVALLASALKYDGGFSPQIQGDGPISLMLADATSDELLDTGQLLAELFYKLYHERSVTIFDSQALRYACRCSRERVNRTHATFPRIEIEAMYVDEELSVTYEYCGTEYAFGPSDIETLFSHQ